MTERMAVAVGEGALGSGAHMGKNERGDGLTGDPFEIDAVPRRNRGGEDAGLRAEGWWRVVADTETVTVVGTAGVLERMEG